MSFITISFCKITIANVTTNNSDAIQLCYASKLQPNKTIKLAWDQCTSDDDCGVDHKCCTTNDGTRCYRSACPV